jgi:hypothetical protein
MVRQRSDRLAILCRPVVVCPDTVHQAEAAYRALAALLAAQRASFRNVTSETIFLRNIQRDLPPVLDARTRVLADLGENCAPLPAFIQQGPLDQTVDFEIAAAAVLPRERIAWSVRDSRATPSCACAGCRRSGARAIHLGDQVSLHTTRLRHR